MLNRLSQFVFYKSGTESWICLQISLYFQVLNTVLNGFYDGLKATFEVIMTL